ncbi:MAG: hypothetical protein AAF798_13905 [Bacteroidota bacterium]
MEQSILNSIKQLLLIVFSVVLGLFLSERIEEGKKEREAALLLSKIKAEVAVNRQLLQEWAPYHGEIVQRLDSLNNDQQFITSFIESESALFEQVLTRGNLMGDTPSDDAWDIAKSHPLIVYFDYDKLLILSKIYKQQAGTYKPVPKMIELFLSADFNAESQAASNLQTFKNQMREIYSREMQLMHYMKKAETILELEEH